MTSFAKKGRMFYFQLTLFMRKTCSANQIELEQPLNDWHHNKVCLCNMCKFYAAKMFLTFTLWLRGSLLWTFHFHYTVHVSFLFFFINYSWVKSLEKYYCQICLMVLSGKLYTTSKNLTAYSNIHFTCNKWTWTNQMTLSRYWLQVLKSWKIIFLGKQGCKWLCHTFALSLL